VVLVELRREGRVEVLAIVLVLLRMMRMRRRGREGWRWQGTAVGPMNTILRDGNCHLLDQLVSFFTAIFFTSDF
jgi:predicted dehydrogenase